MKQSKIKELKSILGSSSDIFTKYQLLQLLLFDILTDELKHDNEAMFNSLIVNEETQTPNDYLQQLLKLKNELIKHNEQLHKLLNIETVKNNYRKIISSMISENINENNDSLVQLKQLIERNKRIIDNIDKTSIARIETIIEGNN